MRIAAFPFAMATAETLLSSSRRIALSVCEVHRSIVICVSVEGTLCETREPHQGVGVIVPLRPLPATHQVIPFLHHRHVRDLVVLAGGQPHKAIGPHRHYAVRRAGLRQRALTTSRNSDRAKEKSMPRSVSTSCVGVTVTHRQ